MYIYVYIIYKYTCTCIYIYKTTHRYIYIYIHISMYINVTTCRTCIRLPLPRICDCPQASSFYTGPSVQTYASPAGSDRSAIGGFHHENVFHMVGKPKIAGWSISWNILLKLMIWGTPIFRKLPYCGACSCPEMI